MRPYAIYQIFNTLRITKLALQKLVLEQICMAFYSSDLSIEIFHESKKQFRRIFYKTLGIKKI